MSGTLNLKDHEHFEIFDLFCYVGAWLGLIAFVVIMFGGGQMDSKQDDRIDALSTQIAQMEKPK